MHSQLSVIVTQSHQYDLQHAAERYRGAGQGSRRTRRFVVGSPLKSILNGRRLSVPMPHGPATTH